MKQISILIPTYNVVCTTLVGELHRQAETLETDYEIIVTDDGSTQSACIMANQSINELSHCRYLVRQENVGRAAIRNFLACEAQYPWLLFIDSDMVVCRQDYLLKYACSACDSIVYGGVTIGALQPGNLRSMYEKTAEPEHTLTCRQQAPYHDFHTANFMASRELMLTHPFDQRFRHYGYEDVLFGKHMEQQGIPILHIDNPLSFEHFETNADFLSKTEEGLRTLYQFRTELKGYSRLLDSPLSNPYFPLRPLLWLWHKLLGSWERRNLTGQHPSLLLFRLYKLGYYITLSRKK